jgi:hypothetical protein
VKLYRHPVGDQRVRKASLYGKPKEIYDSFINRRRTFTPDPTPKTEKVEVCYIPNITFIISAMHG